MTKFMRVMGMGLMVLSLLTACGSEGSKENGKAESFEEKNSADLKGLVDASLGDIYLYVDGMDVTDGLVSFDAIGDKFSEAEISGESYYATSITNLCPYDLTSVKSFFAKSMDGYVLYDTDISDTYLAVLEKTAEGNYEQVVLGTKPSYEVVLSDGSVMKGIDKIYMLTEEVDFTVPIQVDGEEIGSLPFSDFMGEAGTDPYMYDGSFIYNYGKSGYQGSFLGMSLDDMLVKLTALGMDIPTEVIEIEYFGTNGLEKTGKNLEYSTDPSEDTYFGSVDFFCMYDGMVCNPDVKDLHMGLTAFTNGTGQRWFTYGLEAINFVTK